MQTSLRRKANKIAEASISEEPGAGKPHAGIRAGGVGQLASLPRRSQRPVDECIVSEKDENKRDLIVILGCYYFKIVKMHISDLIKTKVMPWKQFY